MASTEHSYGRSEHSGFTVVLHGLGFLGPVFYLETGDKDTTTSFNSLSGQVEGLRMRAA